MVKIAIYADENIGNYGYYEKPWYVPQVRQGLFLKSVAEAGLLPQITLCRAPMASDESLLRFHQPSHLETVRQKCATNEGALDHGPTLARDYTEIAARYVAGAAIEATQRILAGDIQQALIPIAGYHHAFSNEARLYCIYNDCGLAIQTALDTIAGQVAYIDIDVHQGDGVYRQFASNPRVSIADIHEDWSTLFPHRPDAPGADDFMGRAEHNGEGPAMGTKLNIALPPFQNDADYLRHFDTIEKFVATQAPSFIVFEAGLDALEGDPFAHQNLTLDAIRTMTQRVHGLAKRYADGRLLILGGGGYDMQNCADGWTAVLQTLLEENQKDA